MKLKRIAAFILAAVMLSGIFAGCASGQTTQTTVPLQFVGEQNGKLVCIYTGQAPTVQVNTGNLPVTPAITYSNENGTALTNQPVDTGNYKVKASVTQSGFTGEREIPLIIEKKELTLTAENIDVTEGTPFEPVYQIAENLPAGINITVNITYAGTSENPSDEMPSLPGVYTMTFTVDEANFSGSCTAILTISANTENFTYSSRKMTYDGTAKQVTITNLANHYSVTSTRYEGIGSTVYASSVNAPVNAGTYKVTFNLRVNNVIDASAETSLTIDKKEIQFTAQNLGFDIGEVIEHDITVNSPGFTLEQLKALLIISYKDIDDDSAAVTETEPAAYGRYRVTFTINSQNYTGSDTAEYIFEKDNISLTNTRQVFGDNKTVGLSKYTLKEIWFATENSSDASAIQPVNAGTYQITAVAILPDESEHPLTGTLIISPKAIQFTAQDKEIYPDGTFVHELTSEAVGTIPSYSVTYSDGTSTSANPPTATGTYTVTFTITDPNYSGTATAEYKIKPRTGRLTMTGSSQTFSGALIAITPTGLADYHTQRSTVYTGTDSTSYNSSTAPKNVGTYNVTFTCVTDGVTETLTRTLTITTLTVAVADFNDMTYEKGVSFLSGTHYSIPAISVPAGETLTVSFNGFVAGQTPYLPGEYNYTISTSGNIAASRTSGTIKIVFATTIDALFYAQYYYENVANDFMSTYWAIAEPQGLGAVAGNQFVNTRKYKTSFADATGTSLSFYYRTTNSPASTTIADSRFSLETAVGVDGKVYYHEAGKDAITKNVSLTKANITAVNISALSSYFCTVSAYETFNETTVQGYKTSITTTTNPTTGFGTWVENFSLYEITDSTITAGSKTAVTLDASGKYSFSIDYTSAAHGNAYKQQVQAFSGQTYKSFSSLKITYIIDVFGRILQISTAEKYVMALMSTSVAVTGLEVFEYGASKKLTLNGNSVTIAD